MRLIIFGDSYAQPYPHVDWVWTNQLKQFDSVINHAVSGSSIESSINKFYEYFENDYATTDKIVFLLTDSCRAPIVHNDYNPEWACYINVLDVQQKTGRDDKGTQSGMEQHHTDYADYYKTVLNYTDPKINYYKYFSVLSMLNNLKNDIIVLPCFETYTSKLKLNENIILTKLPLIEICNAEIIGRHADVTWIYPNLDFRLNHILPDNHKIFADTITQCFQTRQDQFRLNNFKQDQIGRRNAHKFMWIKELL